MELHLEDIFGINQITIESSSLKSFSFVLDSPVYIDLILSISAEKLEDVLVHLDLHNCVKNLVNIFAPNLKYLKLSGDDVWIGQSLGKSTSIEKAEFLLASNRRCFKILSEVLCSINSCSKQRDHHGCLLWRFHATAIRDCCLSCSVLCLAWDIGDCKTFILFVNLRK